MVGQHAIALGIGLLSLILFNVSAQQPPPLPPQSGQGEQMPPPPPEDAKGPHRGGPPPLFLRDERFQRMLDLALVPENEVEQSIAKSPMANKMSEQERQKFSERVHKFRDRIRGEALDEAKKMGINVPPAKENDFIKDFWQRRVEMEKKLHEEMEPRRQALMKQIQDDLSKKYGSVPQSSQKQ